MSDGKISRRWRTAALVAIGIAIGTSLTAAPVYTHVGGTVAHLWTHLRPKADARYFTKAQANQRYLRANGKAADADLLDGLDSTAFLGASAKAADADLLDGVDSSGFLGANGKAADANLLDGLDSTAFLGASAKAADADLLDGVDSSGFLGANAKAADANLLDGLDSTAFLRATGKAADADLLDGVDSVDWQRRCRTGVAHAFGLVRGASGFSTTFVDVPESFSCWRGSGRVAARRVSTGTYELILSGSPFNTFCLSAPLVVGAISGDSNNFFAYEPVPCGAVLETRIVVSNTSSGGTLQDGHFTFVWYRIL